MSGIQQRTVWAHPLSKKTLNIKYKVPEGAKVLVLNTTFLPPAVSSSNKSPIKVEVMFDDSSVLKYSNESVSKTSSNKIEITSEIKEILISFYVENDGQRHFVFNGYID